MRVTSDQRKHWLKNTSDSPFNRWLNKAVRGPDDQLDLDKLYEVAERYGIDRRQRYAHLNPGQQRMNIGNLLRSVVPADLYEVKVASSARNDVSATPRPDVGQV